MRAVAFVNLEGVLSHDNEAFCAYALRITQTLESWARRVVDVFMHDHVGVNASYLPNFSSCKVDVKYAESAHVSLI